MTILTDDYILLKEYYFQNHHRKKILNSKNLKAEPLFCRYTHNCPIIELSQEEIDFLKDNNLIRFGEFDKRRIKVTTSLW